MSFYYPNSIPRSKTLNAVVYDFPSEIDAEKIQNTLAGVVKIARVFKDNVSSKDLSKAVVSQIVKLNRKKIVFGISRYFSSKNQFDELNFLKSIKKELRFHQIASRFILNKNQDNLSSVVVQKQKVNEIHVLETGSCYILALTVTVQDFEDWNTRDYGRPESDAKKGMLPLKVARMMINLCGFNAKGKLLVDPFCGMGSILQEGLGRGYRVIGVDFDKKSVAQAQKNLDWFCNFYHLKNDFRLFCDKAQNLSRLLAEKVDVIVTEPFLGPVHNQNDKYLITQKEIDDLDVLYQKCLADWHGVLNNGGLVAMVFPSYYLNNQVVDVKKAVDNCEKLGYIIQAGPWDYYRLQAVVRRKIYLFKKI